MNTTLEETIDHFENIYAIASGTEDDPQFCYVGKTVSELHRYWEFVHCKNCIGGIEKKLYEFIRHHGGIDAYRIVLLDTTEGGLTEADWVRTLEAEGHTLLNANKGNTKVAAKTSESKKLFRAINRKAEKTLEATETSEAPLKPATVGVPFVQTRPYDEVIAEWKAFFAMTIELAKESSNKPPEHQS